MRKKVGQTRKKETKRGRDSHPPDLGIIPQSCLCNTLWRYDGCPYPSLGCYGYQHIKTRWQ
jgi:hypothetical protein